MNFTTQDIVVPNTPNALSQILPVLDSDPSWTANEYLSECNISANHMMKILNGGKEQGEHILGSASYCHSRDPSSQ